MTAALAPIPVAAGQPTVRIEADAEEEPSQWIGRYKILQKLGEGGCGVVYMAEQTEPVRRKVALKVIKPGMDTKQVIARFEAERQALALMDHPNIAKVLDAGTTDKGRPYFVMELVKGIRITDYCDQNHLPTSERLGLFTQVCHAIQHAHQKGIIHRDIKPSNILVTLHDGVPVPKVIDFGIAKATEQPLTTKTVFTAVGQFMGTPAYMSPEQAELSGLDIDTRSDIYALGVLLYELLTGKTPFDARELLQAGLDEMRRRIREEEPVRPSTRLSTMVAADLTEVAHQRQSEPAKLTRFIRGDLDWIVMKCLEKDRTRRYETANGLAMDLRRHLNNEPVVACPPSAAYRFQKLVRRNKVIFAAGCAVAAALVIGLGIAAWQFFEKSKAYNRAVAAEKEAQQVAQFLKDMLKGVGPSVALGQDTKMLRGILDKTAERVGKELTNQPAVKADLLGIMGRTYLDLGEYSKAEGISREALRLRMALFGETNAFVAASLNDLATALIESKKLAEAETLLRQGLAMRKLLFGKESPEVAESLSSLSDAIGQLGKHTEADSAQREALRIQRKVFQGARPELVSSLTGLGLNTTNLDEAEALEREALAMSKELWGDENPDAAWLLYRLSWLADGRGNHTQALTLKHQALAMRRKLLGNDHPDVALSLDNLAEWHLQRNQLDEAEPLLRECLSFREQKMPGMWATFVTRDRLGLLLLKQGKYADAEPLLVAACGSMQKSLESNPEQNRYFLRHAVEHLMLLYRITDQRDQEAQLKKEITKRYRDEVEHSRSAADRGDAGTLNEIAWVLATCEDAEIRDGPHAVQFAEQAVADTGRADKMSLDTLAAAYAETGQFEKAVGVEKEALALLHDESEKAAYASRLQLYSANKPYHEAGVEERVANTLAGIASYLLAGGKFAEAEKPARACLTYRQREMPDDWRTFNSRSVLGGSLLGLKNYTDAEPLLRSGYEGMKQREAKIPASGKIRLNETLERLFQLSEATGQSEKAAEWKKKLAEFDTAAPEKKIPAH